MDKSKPESNMKRPCVIGTPFSKKFYPQPPVQSDPPFLQPVRPVSSLITLPNLTRTSKETANRREQSVIHRGNTIIKRENHNPPPRNSNQSDVIDNMVLQCTAQRKTCVFYPKEGNSKPSFMNQTVSFQAGNFPLPNANASASTARAVINMLDGSNTSTVSIKPTILRQGEMDNDGSGHTSHNESRAPVIEFMPIVTEECLSGVSGTRVKLNERPKEKAVSHTGVGFTKYSSLDSSSRKKPRKQKLGGSFIYDVVRREDDLELISGDTKKKLTKENIAPVETKDAALSSSTKKTPRLSIFGNCRNTWKAKHHHFRTYDEVKPKEEKKLTVTDIANQKNIIRKIGGWKIYYFSGQLEDIATYENEFADRLVSLIRTLEENCSSNEDDKGMNMIKELLKGNMQRSAAIVGQMSDVKLQLLQLLNHKRHVRGIVSRHYNKRNIKKRDRNII